MDFGFYGFMDFDSYINNVIIVIIDYNILQKRYIIKEMR